MDNKEKKYALIQIPAELHEELKAYCELHGYKIGKLTATLIRKFIRNEKSN